MDFDSGVNIPGFVHACNMVVVTQARVHCLMCTHNNQGYTVPEGEYGHIRQCKIGCVATNMLHFLSKGLVVIIIWCEL